jgi:hypothetical protein
MDDATEILLLGLIVPMDQLLSTHYPRLNCHGTPLVELVAQDSDWLSATLCVPRRDVKPIKHTTGPATEHHRARCQVSRPLEEDAMRYKQSNLTRLPCLIALSL